MTIPFDYVSRRKMAIKGMVISAMFFGCRASGEKYGIYHKVETCFNLIPPCNILSNYFSKYSFIASTSCSRTASTVPSGT